MIAHSPPLLFFCLFFSRERLEVDLSYALCLFFPVTQLCPADEPGALRKGGQICGGLWHPCPEVWWSVAPSVRVSVVLVPFLRGVVRCLLALLVHCLLAPLCRQPARRRSRWRRYRGRPGPGRRCRPPAPCCPSPGTRPMNRTRRGCRPTSASFTSRCTCSAPIPSSRWGRAAAVRQAQRNQWHELFSLLLCCKMSLLLSWLAVGIRVTGHQLPC